MFLMDALRVEGFHQFDNLLLAFEDLEVFIGVHEVVAVAYVHSIGFPQVEVMGGFVAVVAQEHDLGDGEGDHPGNLDDSGFELFDDPVAVFPIGCHFLAFLLVLFDLFDRFL